MDSHTTKQPSEGAKSSRPSVSGKKIARSSLPTIDLSGDAGQAGGATPKRTRAHLIKNLPGIGKPTKGDQKRALESIPNIEPEKPGQAKIIPFESAKSAVAPDEAAQPEYHDPAEVEAARKKLAELDDNPFEGVPTPMDVIAQAKSSLGEGQDGAPQFDFTALDESAKRNPAHPSERPRPSEQVSAQDNPALEGSVAALGADAPAPASPADDADKPSQNAEASAPEVHARRVHKVVSPKTADEKPVPKWRARLRIVRRVVLAVVVVLVVLLGAFSIDRWLLHNDAADIQGNWYANGTQTNITITDSAIQLTDDVAYNYNLDTTAKTIEFTFASSTGHGRYWFSSDRTRLIVEDGDYNAFSTFTADIGRAISQFVASIQGKDLEFEVSDNLTVFTRMTDAQLAESNEAAAERLRQAQQAAIEAREARDKNGNGIDDDTGKAIRVVDVNGDGIDDETGQLLSEIDKDGDGILDERDVS